MVVCLGVIGAATAVNISFFRQSTRMSRRFFMLSVDFVNFSALFSLEGERERKGEGERERRGERVLSIGKRGGLRKGKRIMKEKKGRNLFFSKEGGEGGKREVEKDKRGDPRKKGDERVQEEG